MKFENWYLFYVQFFSSLVVQLNPIEEGIYKFETFLIVF